MSRRPLLIGVALGIATAAAVVLLLRGGAITPIAARRSAPIVAAGLPAAPANDAPANLNEARRPGDGPPYTPLLPRSLQDTEVDGELVVGADGQFVATREALRLFDYYFSASGEEPDEVIVARIRVAIDERLPAGAAAQARRLLDRYLEFRTHAEQLFAMEGDEADLEERLARIRALRRQVFGDAEAAALFADEEAAEKFEVEARKRLSDPNLTAEQKRAAVEQLEAQMPASVRADRDAALGPQRLADDEAALRAAGGSPEEIRALRVSRYGEEAADRLEELDRQRAEWTQRYAAYRAERAAIETDPSLSGDQRAARIEALRRQRFRADEQGRAAAADELE